jgi:hypothetical protein
VYITINVNTEPFDNSVYHLNHNVDGLGNSVVAMHAAQCAAIQQTAEEVSASLINGFYGLINTELSQQLQALDSAMKANFGLIQQQAQAMDNTHNMLANDFNRISSRYMKIFDDLDNECYKRIYELDKQAFKLAEQSKDRFSVGQSDTSAMNMLSAEDTAVSKALLMLATANRKALDFIKSLRAYITQEQDMSELVSSILAEDTLDEAATLYLPALCVESETQEYFLPTVDEAGKAAIINALSQYAASANWQTISAEERATLNSEFNKIAEADFAAAGDERVFQTMLQLWQGAELKGVSINE